MSLMSRTIFDIDDQDTKHSICMQGHKDYVFVLKFSMILKDSTESKSAL